ncbi:alpha/beta hydrolase [Actinoplanes sp. NPDC049265]|uniref:alpha/beta hydrolase n=1 Tax=Actinoplanes sp. NPDC049265 TaxID=3363902 RepID=UPI0037140F00
MGYGILLVHGAWHTGRTWRHLAARLRARDIPVAVAELHRGTLAADVEAAAQAAKSLGGPVIACGHSYGGMVISGLPPELVAHLIYLAAPMPDAGETTLGMIAPFPTDLLSCLIPGPGDTTTIDPARAGELLHHQLAPARRREHVAELVPQVMTAGHEPAATATWRSRPSTYVICAEDRTVHPSLQRHLSTRATSSVTLSSDHGCYLSHEEEVAALLSELANG